MRFFSLLLVLPVVTLLTACNDQPSSEQVSTLIDKRLQDGPSMMAPDLKYLDQQGFTYKLIGTEVTSRIKQNLGGLNIACVFYKLHVKATSKNDALAISENVPFRLGTQTKSSRNIATLKEDAGHFAKAIAENAPKGKCLKMVSGLGGGYCEKYELAVVPPAEVTAKVNAYYKDVYKFWKFNFAAGSEFPFEADARLCANLDESPARWSIEDFTLKDPASKEDLHAERDATATENSQWRSVRGASTALFF